MDELSICHAEEGQVHGPFVKVLAIGSCVAAWSLKLNWARKSDWLCLIKVAMSMQRQGKSSVFLCGTDVDFVQCMLMSLLKVDKVKNSTW